MSERRQDGRGGMSIGRWVCPGVLALALLASDAAATPWCAVDDPAGYHAGIEVLRAAGQRDLSALECPPIADPQTLPDEIKLPMPCGRAMLFRKVPVPAEHVLDQKQAALGDVVPADQAAPLAKLATGPWDQPVAGSFSGFGNGPGPDLAAHLESLAERAYYLGKYEVTEPQFALYRSGLLDERGLAVDADDPLCASFNEELAAFRPGQIPPAVDLSWFDAVSFAHAYTSWLLAVDRRRLDAGLPPQLPWEQGNPGYLRLPEEAEWEYAARGAAVMPAQRGQRVHRVIDPATGRHRQAALDEVASLSQGRAGAALVSGVGQYLPNVLGLYDMLGNAEEIVLNLFRLTAADGLHGQPGGYVVRGGSSTTSTATIGVGHRREVPLYRLDGDAGSAVTGTRLLLGAPVFVGGVDVGNRWQTGLLNPTLIEAMAEARERLVRSTDGRGGDLVGGLEAVRRQCADLDAPNAAGEAAAPTAEGLGELCIDLAELQTTLERETAKAREAARAELRERVTTALIVSSAIGASGRHLFDTLLRFAQAEERVEDRPRSDPDRQAWDERRPAFLRLIHDFVEKLDAQFEHYLGMVSQLSRSEAAATDNALAAVEREFREQGLETYLRHFDPLRAHIAEAAELQGEISEQMKQRWLLALDDVREQREQRFGDLRLR